MVAAVSILADAADDTRETKWRWRISGEPAADDEEGRDTDEEEETQESVVHGFRPERVDQRQIAG